MTKLLLSIVVFGLGFLSYNELRSPAARAMVFQELHTLTKKPRPAVAWKAPSFLPAQPHWTWTTTDGKTYHEVKIIRVDAAAVTITDSEGGGRIPLATLSPDMQKFFNYDPVAAAAAQEDFDDAVAADKVEAQKVADQTADQKSPTNDGAAAAPPTNEGRYLETDNYDSAIGEAKANNRLLLLHFTGSDWCPACKLLDEQDLSTSTFHSFSASKFVVVTVDQPRGFQLAPDVVQQNARLSQKYAVNAVPTLIVTDADGKELGRSVGCPPGGPDQLVTNLKQYCP